VRPAAAAREAQAMAAHIDKQTTQHRPILGRDILTCGSNSNRTQPKWSARARQRRHNKVIVIAMLY
jgi:hypothetical protein